MRILYIDIDSLRPDHLGCYGYHRNTSPAIDALAKESVRFTNYYTSDAPCLPSRTALYTGRFGIHTGVVGHGGTASDLFVEGPTRNFMDRVECSSLPANLKWNGYHTAQISPFGQRHSARQFYAGFNEIHNTGGGGNESAEEVTPVVMKWLEDRGRADNWYLHVNYWDPHTPYRAPESFGNPFAEDPLPEWITEEVIEEHQQCVGPHCIREFNMYNANTDPKFPRQPGEARNLEEVRAVFDGYDCGVRYVDDQLAQIFDWLKREGLWEETAILISADHGENLGELGIYSEHGTADQITCRVPMIIKWPGAQQGTVDEGLHYSLDLAPTFSDLLEIETQPDWDGQSYAASLTKGEDTSRDQLVISQCAHVCQRSVRWGDWLYIRTYHDGFHLFDKEMLFDIAKDPHEQHNLADQHPELCREGAARLLDWHDTMMLSSKTNVDPMWTVLREGGPFHAQAEHVLDGYCDYLEKTDRAWAVPKLQERHPIATSS